jgi:ABC-type Fe3+/spermidine/putrescine transport system ATPase subunit
MLYLHHVSKSFAGAPVLSDINLRLEAGQILCLLGPSGCGKTTLLRLIAGLESPDTGVICFDGQDLAGVPPHRRGFGLMFQEFALFPHKNAGQNVAFGLHMQTRPVAEVERTIGEMLALVGLAGLEGRDVNSLSGGERQRVALARSLAPGPRLLMLDEPLGSLDRALRERLMGEIRQILKRLGLTALYVTHDQIEAFTVADRIIVMHRGRIEQEAPPEQLYRHPQTPFVAQFLGFTNLLPATCLADDQLETPFGLWPIPTAPHPVGASVTVLIRPEAASLAPEPDAIPLEVEVAASLFRGRFYQVTLLAAGYSLTFEMTSPPGEQKVTLWLSPEGISLL